MPVVQWERIQVQEVPLEKVRDLVEALADQLDLRLERREHMYSEPDFRFVPR